MSTESTEASSVKPAVLITIISESVLRDRIVKILKSKGVTGYTLNEVLGEGGHGRRMGDIAGFNTNIEIKTIVSSEMSDDIFSALAENRNGHALIAFRHSVEAMSN
jgi:nitrogen regulatory protein PII